MVTYFRKIEIFSEILIFMAHGPNVYSERHSVLNLNTKNITQIIIHNSFLYNFDLNEGQMRKNVLFCHIVSIFFYLPDTLEYSPFLFALLFNFVI